ncbi:GntR family transcriptional regulator [Rhodobacteraceae bacterium F11138]|nr:GntR family transcriptional regulator [Rhodobacteraceae bacterium F11138]
MITHDPSNLRHRTYEAIKSLIITGQLAPGSRVTEAELTERIEVSRTPVREALSRLEQEGFVHPRQRNGYAVMQIDVTTVSDVFELREILETEATKMAVARVDDAGRARLRGIVDECDEIAARSDRSVEDELREIQIGIDLHRLIAELSGNSLLQDVLGGVLDRCQAYVWLEVSNLKNLPVAREEHRRIVSAICTGDSGAAVSLTRSHILEARANVLSLLRLREDVKDFMSRSR